MLSDRGPNGMLPNPGSVSSPVKVPAKEVLARPYQAIAATDN